MEALTKRNITSETTFVSGPRKSRDRNGNWDVDPNLTWFSGFHEMTSCRAGGCEDGRSISIWILVDQIDCFIQRRHLLFSSFRKGDCEGTYLSDEEDWSEDLRPASSAQPVRHDPDLRISRHIRCASDHRRSYPITIRESLNHGVSTIQQDLCTFVNGSLDQSLDPLFRCRGDDWSS